MNLHSVFLAKKTGFFQKPDSNFIFFLQQKKRHRKENFFEKQKMNIYSVVDIKKARVFGKPGFSSMNLCDKKGNAARGIASSFAS